MGTEVTVQTGTWIIDGKKTVVLKSLVMSFSVKVE